MDCTLYSDTPFLNLPVELIRIIASLLDFESKLKLGCSCALLRDAIFPGQINIEKDALKSSSVFVSDRFKLIADRIAESIDLSSISDFSEQSLRGLKLMKNVNKIDVTYTNLNFENIMAMAPSSLRDVTLNLTNFDSTVLARPAARKQVVKFLKHITDIHFKLRKDFCEGPTYPYDTCMMHQNVKVTYVGQRALSYSLPKFNDCMKYEANFRTLTFSVNLLLPIRMYSFLYNLSLNDIELITYNFDQENSKIKVMMTPEVANALRHVKNPVKINKHIMSIADSSKIIDSYFYGHVKFICWNKKVIGDADFYGTIAETINQAIPSHICVHSHKVRSLIETGSPHCVFHDCVETPYINNSPIDFNLLFESRYETVTILRECYCVNNPETGHDNIDLNPINSIFFNVIKLNLTFLSLDKVNLTDEAWERVFVNVPNLATLNIIGDPDTTTQNYKSLSKSIHLSKRLKHVKILELDINCRVLFKAFSKCSQLETIYIDSIAPVAKFENEIVSYINLVLGCKHLAVLAIENVYDDDRKHLLRLKELIEDLCKEQKRKTIEFLSLILSLSIYTNAMEHATDRFFTDNIVIHK